MLVYSTFTPDLPGRLTHFYDLEQRSDVVILPHAAEHLLWSPDSQRFSYTVSGEPDAARGIYLYEVRSSTARLVYEPPCAPYGLLNNPRGVCGAIREMAWVSSDVMLIQRFVGAMPETISSLQLEIPANTTTLLRVANGSQALVDAPRRPYGDDVSRYGAAAFTHSPASLAAMEARSSWLSPSRLDSRSIGMARMPCQAPHTAPAMAAMVSVSPPRLAP